MSSTGFAMAGAFAIDMAGRCPTFVSSAGIGAAACAFRDSVLGAAVCAVIAPGGRLEEIRFSMSQLLNDERAVRGLGPAMPMTATLMTQYR
ncbi:hypothetical protein UC34_00270 [Pandoraea vervacti]|uniref:Uncharacterized protein n=1 Tax=Pandoraea vervacti TaxID=656178 RepID=A0ABM5STW2_9BURK|nr:hypothetical protein UC34_00270 [Pandoraea vervacti]